MRVAKGPTVVENVCLLVGQKAEIARPYPGRGHDRSRWIEMAVAEDLVDRPGDPLGGGDDFGIVHAAAELVTLHESGSLRLTPALRHRRANGANNVRWFT